MPRYCYRCTECEELSTILHMADETITECPKCKNPRGLIKLLTAFSTSMKKTTKAKVGQTTEEFIQDAREELKKQKDILDFEIPER